MTTLFISHAWEDKADLVEPLVQALEAEPDFHVWYDKYALTMGDRLLEKISQGLSECDYGVVVLSAHFFSKQWPKNELDGLFALETEQRKLILPIWKDVTAEDIKRFSPVLVGRLGVLASVGVPALVSEIRRAVQVGDRAASFSPTDSLASRFQALDLSMEQAEKARKTASSKEGVVLAELSAEAVFDTIEAKLRGLALNSQTLKFRIEKSRDAIDITCPFRIQAYGCYHNPSWYGAKNASLEFKIEYETGYGSAERSTKLFNLKAGCLFDGDNSVLWKVGENSILDSGQLAVRLIEELFVVIDSTSRR